MIPALFNKLSQKLAIRLRPADPCASDNLSDIPSKLLAHEAVLRSLYQETEVESGRFPYSDVCNYQDFEHSTFRKICGDLGADIHYHRKLWEWVYVCHNLTPLITSRTDLRAIGFGTGCDPIASFLAKHGVEVVATDLSAGDERAYHWMAAGVDLDAQALPDCPFARTATGIQHAASLDLLYYRKICPADNFRRLVQRVDYDLAKAPDKNPDVRGPFDIMWSSCVIEHIGDKASALEAMFRSVDLLKPGGIAVHTVEFDCLTAEGVDHSGCNVFGLKDLLPLIERIRAAGCNVLTRNFAMISAAQDLLFDRPPYKSRLHLKLSLLGTISTSLGVVIARNS